MNIAAIIDKHLLPPHGLRKGLSYAQLAVLLLTYIISEGERQAIEIAATYTKPACAGLGSGFVNKKMWI